MLKSIKYIYIIFLIIIFLIILFSFIEHNFKLNNSRKIKSQKDIDIQNFYKIPKPFFNQSTRDNFFTDWRLRKDSNLYEKYTGLTDLSLDQSSIKFEDISGDFQESSEQESTEQESSREKPKIWMYWETLPNNKKPSYIDLCYESTLFNCGKCFDIILLDEKNIFDYLPEIKDIDFSKLHIAQKVDYFRYLLLYKYGGLWIDADILIIKCLCPIYKNLNKHDYIGFGCGFDQEECGKKLNGYTRPLNWMMISKPKTDYLKCIKDKAEEKIFGSAKIMYHGIGKDILKECFDKLKSEKNWDYLHIPSKCNEYDINGNKLNNIFVPMEYKGCEKERYFFPLYNTAPGYPDWFKDLTLEELKNNDLPLKPFIDASFTEKNKCCNIESN